VLFRTIPVPTGVAELSSPPVVFWIRPPEQVGAAGVHVPPLPVTVKPPVAPVVFSRIPLGAPLLEMLRNVNPPGPIVVFATFNAVPVVVVMVLTIDVLFWVTVRVPPPVAVKPGLTPVVRERPPLNVMVLPLLAFRKMPWPVSVIGPLKITAPPDLF
jgi:hypothetical protein